MPSPLTLALLKQHLRLSAADTSEDALLGIYQLAAEGAFVVESKRRWPKDGESTDADTGAYVDEVVLNADEQAIGLSWLLLTAAHLYENRQNVVTDTRTVAVEVPLTARSLMNLIRVPTL
jgi:hypothetical protein